MVITIKSDRKVTFYFEVTYMSENKVIQTTRLILRPWEETDAENLYKYAKDPLIGPITGWPPHESVEQSLEVIRNVLKGDETYAVCLKEDNKAIGCISLMIGEKSNLSVPDNEGELGYWIGVPFWGRGLIPEGLRAVIRHAFLDLGLSRLWCGYFEGNLKSKRCMEKCGFTFHHTNFNIYWKMMDDFRTEHVTRLTREDWFSSFEIVKLCEHRELKEEAAEWFSGKWSVPKEAYLESIEDSFTSSVPRWYLCLDCGKIIAGMGVIENDFHDRKDLAPNVCAVYTEEEYRNQGIAGRLLNYVCDDMAENGIDTLYLLTDHNGFYERYGWEFYCMAQGDGEEKPSRLYIHKTM